MVDYFQARDITQPGPALNVLKMVGFESGQAAPISGMPDYTTDDWGGWMEFEMDGWVSGDVN